MDILSHALFAWTLRPDPLALLGAVLPDLTMVRRKPEPDAYYVAAHSLAAPALLSLGSPSLALGVLSHVLLDLVSHGPVFAPRLLHPLSGARPRCFPEWEFGSIVHTVLFLAVAALFLAVRLP